MRVIAGRFKGVTLPAAKTGTRPTTDRTKEALFSRLDALGLIEDARVLDLFAGTGALGIEALSRGAQELVAVESAGPAAALLTTTLGTLRHQRGWQPDMSARAVRRRAERFVADYAGAPFALILIDPPYAFATAECEELLAALALGEATDARSTIILERSTRSQDPKPPEGWAITDQRHYGETAVFVIEALH
ncbi:MULTISPECIES: 16S rRNA (guanine(966)-N(2))-methyltransferase RsmD [Bifidobacterium]|jgi:16S rRNA (guanine966-N2)-methyltransferase|uniref:16S rRNA (Guanine(966)-N(2))-methyltransferase RsmD n=1 Tax=Bifidobacterium tibiigranuli TaxID=2172043 RepID=A0A5N6S3N7_9BIFI|nr:16S rRNA (guanine(966)-N(2))-methyltransferase RsmD [Bifidobacterium tibiigranuli]KAE8129100.1 16S rRNA (guanine(966)-N(2))-methyltransferase RsmD [Bifidobacterium tibiigranuli]KAE8129338.1 16S rRNA (guanine(966)-N(2))-methyltransferase RsmD [Bifidobacterium tibiigranuli]MCH3975302.1 16S rRNA (guanine(966)-N(2))-methyltransferase RsmD [Bifidobacterium tibiigranuli]MCH4203501.1 16S rRNA (guanine(966)-N(2))-methyltransferase RsmD [Bifidobacterium tibiigranuli]MCH4273887.1 16S rRNA (guanine(96